MKSYLKLTLQGLLIATVSSLVLATGIAHAGPDPTMKPCPNCKHPFRPPTHGHHAKIKPGQKNEDDPSKWPGPHPGIGGAGRVQMGDGSVRGSMNGAVRLQGGRQALPAVQRSGQ